MLEKTSILYKIRKNKYRRIILGKGCNWKILGCMCKVSRREISKNREHRLNNCLRLLKYLSNSNCKCAKVIISVEVKNLNNPKSHNKIV